MSSARHLVSRGPMTSSGSATILNSARRGRARGGRVLLAGGTMQGPARIAGGDVLAGAVTGKLGGQLLGEFPGLVAIQKPVGAHLAIPQEPLFVQADDPGASESGNLFQAHAV